MASNTDTSEKHLISLTDDKKDRSGIRRIFQRTGWSEFVKRHRPERKVGDPPKMLDQLKAVARMSCPSLSELILLHDDVADLRFRRG
jgi:hypothetical protein